MEYEFLKISLLPTLSFTFLRAFYDFHTGGLAQLARALAWHARGQRFESVILHTVGFDRQFNAIFFPDDL